MNIFGIFSYSVNLCVGVPNISEANKLLLVVQDKERMPKHALLFVGMLAFHPLSTYM